MLLANHFLSRAAPAVGNTIDGFDERATIALVQQPLGPGTVESSKTPWRGQSRGAGTKITPLDLAIGSRPSSVARAVESSQFLGKRSHSSAPIGTLSV